MLDESLSLIKRYLIDRLTNRKGGWSANASEIVVDIGVLGLRREAEKGNRHGGEKRVCTIRLCRSMVIIGPVWRPEPASQPCPMCLERRWLNLCPAEEQHALEIPGETLVIGPHPLLTPFALESIWNTIETIFSSLFSSSQPEESTDQLYVLSLDSLYLLCYPLVPDSLCPICARPAPETPERAVIQLSSRPKKGLFDYHPTRATDYNLSLPKYVNLYCGMLGSQALPDFGHRVNAPVTGSFKVRSKFSFHNAWWSGHGNIYEQSRYLGMLEGFERYAGQLPRAKKVSLFDSYENLQSIALNPAEYGLYRPEFYDNPHSPYRPYSPDRKMYWVWGYSFQQARPILVPEQLVYYLDYRSDYANYVQDCSNGCATGSSIEEAIFFGLLELIERDSFLISWYAKLQLPRIDPWSCHDPEIHFLLDRVKRMGYDMHFFDMRLDLKVPTVMGVAERRDAGIGSLVFAAGASLDPESAIRGAFCEVATYVADFDQRVTNVLESLRAMVQDYTRVTELEHHALLYGLPEMASHAKFLFQKTRLHSMEELYKGWMEEQPRSYDLLDDLHYCLKQILDQGMDVIVVDQTCPEQEPVGLKTASVIVPGLLPIDFGWRRQRAFDMPRLRTVPRTAGFMPTNFEPDLQNMAPHPFP